VPDNPFDQGKQRYNDDGAARREHVQIEDDGRELVNSEMEARKRINKLKYAANKMTNAGFEANLKVGSLIPADKTAEALRRSRATGIPVESAQRLEPETSAEKITRRMKAELAETGQSVKNWVKDSVNASVAQDDIENLSYIERQIKHIGSKYEQGSLTSELSDIGWEAVTGDITEEGRARQKEIGGRLQDMPDYGIKGFTEQVPGATAEQIPIQLSMIPDRLAATAASAGTGALVGGVLGLPAGGAGAIPGAVAGAGTGARLGWKYGSAVAAGRMEMSLAYLDYEKEMDRETALGIAGLVGVVNGALEMFGVEMLYSKLPGVRKFTREGIKETLAKPSVKQALLDWGKVIGSTMVTEGITETLQEMVTSAGGLLGSNDYDSAEDFLADMLSPEKLAEYMESARAGAQGGGGLGAVLSSPQFALDVREVKAAKSREQQWLDLGERISKSKLQGRDVPKMGEAIDAMSNRDSVFIDVLEWDKYWQTQNQDPKAVAKEIMGDTFEYESATESDHQLQIAFSSYATKLAPTPHNKFFSQEIRFTPDEMNARETKEFEKAMEAEPSKENNPVYDELVERLVAAGTEKSLAEDQAAPLAAYLNTVGKRLRLDPEELLDYYGLSIVNEAFTGEGEVFEQKKRGYLAISPDKKMQIGLLKDANLSTFIHESSHVYLEIMADQVKKLQAKSETGTLTPEESQMIEDSEILMPWMRINSLDEMKVEHKEQFARGFEAYTMEGKAPSIQLRQVFARFRAWMLTIYRSVKALDVQLNDEVRQVFDRMLSTDEEIDAAKKEAQLVPLFTNAISAGMTEAQFKNYTDTIEAANVSATEQLEQQLIKEWTREQAKEWKKEFANVKDEVEAELLKTKVYIALSVLQTGKLPDGTESVSFKLSSEEIKENYGDEALAVIKSHRAARTKESTDSQEIAEILGYSSGDQLIKELLKTPKLKEAVTSRANEIMKERHGDLISNAAELSAKAKEVVLNEKQAEILRSELIALNKLKGKVAPMLNTQEVEQRKQRAQGVSMMRSIPPLSAFRNIAKGRIEQHKIRDLQPGKYMVAMRQEGRKAVEAALKGDNISAAVHKQAEILNLELYKAALKAKNEANKQVKFIRKFTEKNTRKRLGKTDYLEQIDALLERFDFKTISLRAIDQRKSLVQFIESQAELGLTVDLPPEVLDTAYRKNYRDMTVYELSAVRDSFAHIDHLSKLKNKLLKLKDQRDFNALVEGLSVSIRENTTTKLQSIETGLPQKSMGKLWRQFIAMHRKVASYARVFDGQKDGGLAWEALIRPFNDAASREAELRNQAAETLHDIFKPLMDRFNKVKTKASKVSFGWYEGGLYKQEFYPELQTDRFNGSISHAGKLMIALNWGNAGNRDRLLSGYGWTEDNAQSVLNTLTEDDWAFVQKVWRYIDSFWPEIAALSKRVDGVEPTKVDGIPVDTPFGIIQGMYFPIQRNPDTSNMGFFESAKEAAERAMNGSVVRGTTQHGFRKERAATVVGQPLNLDLSVIFRHINNVIHDLTHYEALIDGNRIVKNGQVHTAINDAYSPEVYSQFTTYLNDVATGDMHAQTAFDRIMVYLRTGVSIVGMGLNLTTAAIQVTGFSQSVARIRPEWAWQGLKSFYAHPIKMAEEIHEKSGVMRNRARTQLREINEIQNKIEGGSNLISSYFWMIVKMQQTVDFPTWQGQYLKSISEGETESRAISIADQAVLDSQMGGQVKDLSAIQRGNPLMKLFTAFYSYFNATMNLTAEAKARTDFKKPKDIGLFVGDMLLLYTVPAVLGLLIREAIRPGDEDDDKTFFERAVREQANFMLGTLVIGRELGGMVQGYANYSGPAGTRYLSEMSRLGTQIGQGEVDKALLRSANNAAGILLHYPAGQVDRTVQGIVALSEGETENPLAVFVGAPK